MKIILFILTFLLALPAAAQRPDHSEACRKAMSQLGFLAGDWEGTATVIRPNCALQVHQTEHVEWKLNGLVLSIEGTGKMATGETGFQAFAVLHFDPMDQQYKMRSFVKEGISTQAYFKILSPNNFEWGFDVATGKTRYHIVLDESARTWRETAEYSADGQTWMKFIEMNLAKK